MEELSFTIPNDEPTIIQKLIDAVPKYWNEVSCLLNAPQQLIEDGIVCTGIGFEINRCEEIHISSVVRSHANNVWPELTLGEFLIARNRIPAFIKCESAHQMKSFGEPTLSPIVAEIMCHAIRNGYVGQIAFRREGHTKLQVAPSAGCHITFGGFEGKQSKISFVWWKQDSETWDDVAPILAACEQLGLPKTDSQS
ncbi:MAG: hypothetical protein WC477_03555 [Patescibacteria group bacterium]